MYNWTIIYFGVRNDTNHGRLIEETKAIVAIVIATIKKKKEKNHRTICAQRVANHLLEGRLMVSTNDINNESQTITGLHLELIWVAIWYNVLCL